MDRKLPVLVEVRIMPRLVTVRVDMETVERLVGFWRDER